MLFKLNHRPTVGVFMPFISENRGGPDVTAMWLIQSLCTIYQVTLVTTRQFELLKFNKFAGTSLTREDFRIRVLPSIPTPSHLAMSALQGPIFQRFAKRCSRDFDVCISAMNPLDFGVRGIHFLADLGWLRFFPPSADGLVEFDRSQPMSLRNIYHRLCSRLDDRSGRNLLQDDLLVSNSSWVASILSELAVESQVIFPPVPIATSASNWDDRCQDFVWIGRIAPSKRVESAINIIRLVREAGVKCKLHIVGNALDKEYAASIHKLAQAVGDWVTLKGPLYGAEKTRYLENFQYALHTRADEPFGITVAELVKSGCIVFGPNSAGSAEILGRENLLFSTEREAADKILRVIRNPRLIEESIRHLQERAKCFSTGTFQSSVCRLVAEFLEKNPSALGPDKRRADDGILTLR